MGRSGSPNYSEKSSGWTRGRTGRVGTRNYGGADGAGRGAWVVLRALREAVAEEQKSPQKAAQQLTLDLPEATYRGCCMSTPYG